MIPTGLFHLLKVIADFGGERISFIRHKKKSNQTRRTSLKADYSNFFFFFRLRFPNDQKRDEMTKNPKPKKAVRERNTKIREKGGGAATSGNLDKDVARTSSAERQQKYRPKCFDVWFVSFIRFRR